MSLSYISQLLPARHRSLRTSRRLRKTRANRAFTMIEALFACMILIFGFLPMMSIMIMAVRVERQGQARSIAYNVARYEMEQLQQRSWQNLPVTGDTTFIIPTTLSGQLPYGMTLTGKYNITTPNISPATTLTNLREITVSVSWTTTVNRIGAAYRNTATPTNQTPTATSEVRLTTLVAQQQYQSGS